MNMIKCALQFQRKSNQHCPNHCFTIIIHKSDQIKSNVGFFDERGKPEYPGKNLSWQSRGPTNSIHICHKVRKSNPGHIGGRQVLSPLGQPCHQATKVLFIRCGAIFSQSVLFQKYFKFISLKKNRCCESYC